MNYSPVKGKTRELPVKDWWDCTICKKPQRIFYATIIGNDKLCNFCWAIYLWDTDRVDQG